MLDVIKNTQKMEVGGIMRLENGVVLQLVADRLNYFSVTTGRNPIMDCGGVCSADW